MPPNSVAGSCVHCKKDLSRAQLARGETYCCAGCRRVAGLLKERGWADYYRYRERSPSFRAAGAVAQPVLGLEAWGFLDDPAFEAEFATASASEKHMTFYLEGIHCLACLWLLEKLPEWVDGLQRIQVDPLERVVHVAVDPGTSFARVAHELDLLGYPPQPLRSGDFEGARRARLKELRMDLVRLAIAGAAASNIMWQSISVYAGAGGWIERLLTSVSAALFVPALVISGYPLYREAWLLIKKRRIAVEIPLMAGISLGTVVSLIHLWQGSAVVYFDSISALLFFILVSRFVLKGIQSRALSSNRLLHHLAPSFARLAQDPLRRIPVQSLRPGDRILLRAGEASPVDGKVRSGVAFANRAALSGESTPTRLEPGSPVEAGWCLEAGSEPLEIEALAWGYKTRLGSLIRQVEAGLLTKAPLLSQMDRWAMRFTLLVGSLAVIAGALALSQGFAAAADRFFGVLIIACPCGLALAAPLSYIQGLGWAARRGVLIKNAEGLERLQQAQEVLFDKTGTLTEGELEVEGFGDLEEAFARAITAVELRSSHPIARSMIHQAEARWGVALRAPGFLPEASHFEEKPPLGVQARVDGSLLTIERDAAQPVLHLRWEGRPPARLGLADRPRQEAASLVQALAKRGQDVWLLTGDSASKASGLAKLLGIAPGRVLSELTPEKKCETARSRPRALMVGDGANDAAALKAGFASIAVQGSLEIARQAADAVLLNPGLGGLLTALEAGERTLLALRLAVGISLAYNLVAVACVMAGWVHPLAAAVIMPMSSLSVFACVSAVFWLRPRPWTEAA